MEANENPELQSGLYEEEEMAEELRPELESEEEVTALFQAIVFASSDLVTVAKVAKVVEGFTLTKARSCMANTNEQLLSINSPFEMVEQGGGFRFRTRAKWAPWVRSVLASEGQSSHCRLQAADYKGGNRDDSWRLLQRSDQNASRPQIDRPWRACRDSRQPASIHHNARFSSLFWDQ